MKESWLLNALPMIPLIGTVVYGFYRMFRKKVPLYFQMVVCAAFCALLELVYNSMITLCTEGGGVAENLGGLAMGGFCAFLFAANYGQFDSIVDGGQKQYRHCRLFAWIAPIVFLAAEAFRIHLLKNSNVLFIAVSVIAAASLPSPAPTHF